MGAAEEARMVKRVFLFGLLPLVVYAVVAGKLYMNNRTVESELALKKGKIQHYYENGFNVPDQASIDRQQAIIAEAVEKVKGIASSTEYSLVEVPSDIQEAGVYFKERLYLTQRDLKALADAQQGVAIPGNIGFGEELPEESQVPGLLLKLDMVDKLLRILIQNKVVTVHKIEFVEARHLETYPAEVVSVMIQATASPEALKTTLYEIGNLSPAVVVERLKVAESKNELLDVQLQVSQLLGQEEKGRA